jgi:hypothetical protein
LPLPVAPEVTLIHAALLVALQLQPVPAVTATVPVAPPALTLTDTGEIDGAHGAPAWVTVNVSPPIVSDPVRDALDVFAATAYDTDPLADPDAPCVTVIHAVLLTALQLQPLAAVTVTTPLDAPDTTLTDAGAMEELHGTPACVTVNVLPPIVRVPIRDELAELAATT